MYLRTGFFFIYVFSSSFNAGFSLIFWVYCLIFSIRSFSISFNFSVNLARSSRNLPNSLISTYALGSRTPQSSIFILLNFCAYSINSPFELSKLSTKSNKSLAELLAGNFSVLFTTASFNLLSPRIVGSRLTSILNIFCVRFVNNLSICFGATKLRYIIPSILKPRSILSFFFLAVAILPRA